MKLLKKLGTRLVNNRLESWGVFECTVCLKEIELSYNNGKRNQSCGCNKNIKHGDSYTKLYNLWGDMKQRILNPNNKGYKNYGGRGITICPEWVNDYMKFGDWALSNGYKEGLQINRINNDGNYEPNNCNFVTRTENMRNTRKVKLTLKIVNEIKALWNTENYTQQEIAKKYDITQSAISFVINNKRWVKE